MQLAAVSLCLKMAVFEVYSQPELRRYKTHVCSKAAIVQLICLALTWIPPLLIAYRSQGFWQKTDSYAEQPDVKFKYRLLLVVDTSTDGDYVAWSTYQNFNQLQMEHLRVPLVKAKETDVNGNGLNDQLHVQIEVPLLDTEKVHGVKCILIFDYLLRKFSYFQMESMAYISDSSPLPGSRLDVVGDLALQIAEPLGHKGIDIRYNDSVINSGSIYAEDYDLANIFSNYTSRNVTTELQNDYKLWTSVRGAGKPFVIDALIRYREEFNVLYNPGFWHLIKWGWVQYVAILVVFWFVFTKIKIFIFQNQLVTTIVERPFKPKVM